MEKLKRDLKKVNVEPKQILKKDSLYRKQKKESSRNDKKLMERFGETKKCEVQDESDAGDKNIVEGVVQKWLIFIKLFMKRLNKSGPSMEP